MAGLPYSYHHPRGSPSTPRCHRAAVGPCAAPANIANRRSQTRLLPGIFQAHTEPWCVLAVTTSLVKSPPFPPSTVSCPCRAAARTLPRTHTCETSRLPPFCFCHFRCDCTSLLACNSHGKRQIALPRSHVVQPATNSLLVSFHFLPFDAHLFCRGLPSPGISAPVLPLGSLAETEMLVCA